MSKISFPDALKSTTVFLNNEEIEAYYDTEIKKRIKDMQRMLQKINYKEGLITCIQSYRNSLESIVTLLGISKEKFKRVISWIRLSYGYTFESEWDYPAIRDNFIRNERFRDDLCELLINGRKSDKFKRIIPKYILDDFFIDVNVLARLSSIDFLSSLAKDKFGTEYNNRYCQYYRELVLGRIKQIAGNNGFFFKSEILVSEICPSIIKSSNFKVFLLQSTKNEIVIASNYYMTTSSTQGKFATEIIEPLHKKLNEDNKVLINMLDGAGWVGRPADFYRIYSACNYYINLKNIEKLDIILKEL